MKVLHILEAFLRISENWILPQIRLVPGVDPGVLCNQLINPDLFSLGNARLFRDPPPWSVACGLPRLLDSLAFRCGKRHLIASMSVARWAPDIIHAHFGMRGWDMLPLKRRLRVPMITSFYGIDAWRVAGTEPGRTRLRELFSTGEIFLAEGPAMRDRLVAVGVPPQKVRVLRLGVDLDRLAFVERDFSPPLRVVMMARFVEKKGLPDGLRAFAEAIQRGADLRMTIIGDATDASGERIKRELKEIVATRPLNGRITFSGMLSPVQAREVMRQAHIFLCPSKHAADGDAEGGSPLSLTEAMALGLLCIGTRHCDIPEVIRDGETGFLRDSSDITGLADALFQAATDPGSLPALCRNGRQHVERCFSIPAMTTSLKELYSARLL